MSTLAQKCEERMALETERLNYPRVSEILDKVCTFAAAGINPEVLENAAQRGTDVHAQVTAIVRNLFRLDASEEVSAYVQGFEEWHEIHPFSLYTAEERFYDDTAKYSGKMDLVVRFPGEEHYTLIDIKTSATYSKRWPLQIAAYTHLLWNAGVPVRDAMILQLRVKKTKGEVETFECKEAKEYKYDIEDLKHYGTKWQHILDIYEYYYRK